MIEITLVVVPPNGAGAAYGHDERGDCVTVSGERQAMLDLFHRLRAASREGDKLVIGASEYASVASIERGVCPTHTLPEAPDGSSVAWAPY